MSDALPVLMQEGEGPTLVLIHGFGGTKEQWGPVIRRLRHRAMVAVDLPGHGTALQWPNRHSPVAARDAVVATLDHHGIERAHLVGHSRGGVIASLVALKAPERIERMTLLAPGGYSTVLDRDGLAAMTEAATLAEMRAALAPVYDPAPVPGLVPVRSPAQRRALREILDTMGDDGPQATLNMGRIADTNIPLTMIWGSADKVLPIDSLVDLPSTATLTRLDGAGHMLIEERPEDIAHALA